MNSLFPFGFPWPTAMYLTLFVITAAIYMVFMNYVLAGAIILVVGYLTPGARRRVEGQSSNLTPSGLGLILKIVRDWLPAILGLAITAGIAPLLFLQILYKHEFYTANLLLSHHFMLLLPALIVAYFMLYLIKSHALTGTRTILRGPVILVAFACFSYTTWAWTENHVLSLHKEVWINHYATGKHIFRNAEIWPRLGYWITASFSTLAVAIGWQLHWGRRFHDRAQMDRATNRLRLVAMLGLIMSAAEGWLWLRYLDAPARNVVLSTLAFPYALLSLSGMGIQTAGWLTARTRVNLTTSRLVLISTGVLMTIVGTLVVREARRLASIDITSLFDTHRHAFQVGGFGVFVVFFVVNAGVIISCVAIVKRSLRPLH